MKRDGIEIERALIRFGNGRNKKMKKEVSGTKNDKITTKN